MPEAFLGDELQTNKSWPRMINAGVQRLLSPLSDLGKTMATGAGYSPTLFGLGHAVAHAISPEAGEGYMRGLEHAGEAAPRLALQAGASYAGQRFHIPALNAAALGDVALQQFSETDENAPLVQKLGTTALGTAAFHYAPKVGAGVGGSLGKMIGEEAHPILSKVAERGGSLAGTLTAFEAANAGQATIKGESFQDYAKQALSPEHIAGTAATVLPFELLGLMPRSTAGEMADRIAGEQKRRATVLTGLRESDPGPALVPQSVKMFKEGQTSGGLGLAGVEMLNEPEKYGFAPDKQGMLTTEQALGRLKNVLHPTEWGMYDEAGLTRDFVGKGKVKASELQQWMQTKGPSVDVKVLKSGGEPVTQEQERFAQLQHWKDSKHISVDMQGSIIGRNSTGGDRIPLSSTEELVKHFQELHPSEDPTRMINMIREWNELFHKNVKEPGGFNIDQYKVLTPHHGDQEAVLVKLRGKTKYTGPHFSDEDKNVLGFSRGHWVEVGGKKAFSVDEVQSDWGQEAKRNKAYVDSHPPEDEGSWGFEDIKKDVKKTPALLKDYNRLILKATFNHALQNGAEAIVLPDAETAMMTEGHDQSHKLAQYEPGMRLNYDKILPDQAKQLAGVEPQKVDLGPHANARRLGTTSEPPLIFKNADGSPKTTATGLLYDLSKYKAELERRGGIPLIGGGRFVLDKASKMFLRDWEESGAEPVDLKTFADKMNNPARGKNESWPDYYFRTSGMSGELNKPTDPNTLLTTAKQYFDNQWADMGLSKEKADLFTRLSLHHVATLGQSLGETRVLPATGEASFFGSSRGRDLANAMIGLTPTNYRNAMSAWFHMTQKTLHEMMHNIEGQAAGTTYGHVDPAVKKAYEDSIALGMTLTRDEQVGTLRALMKGMFSEYVAASFEPRLEAYADASNYADYATHTREFIADFGSLAVMGMASPRTSKVFGQIDAMFKFMPEHLGWLKGFVKDMAQVIMSMKDFVKRLGWRNENVAVVEQLHENMKKLVRTSDDADATMATFLSYVNTREARPWAPTDWVDYRKFDQAAMKINSHMERYDPTILDVVKEASLAIIPQVTDKPQRDEPLKGGELGKRLSWLKLDFLKPFSTQLVKEFPEMLAAGELGHSYIGAAKDAALAMWRQGSDPLTGNPDFKGFLKLKEGGAVNKAFSAIGRLQNEKDSQRLTMEEKNALPEYKALTKEQKEFLDTKLDQVSAVSIKAAWMRTRALQTRIGGKIAQMLMTHDETMRGSMAERLGQALVDVELEPDLVDPMTGGKDFQDRAALGLRLLSEYPDQTLIDKGREAVRKSIEPFNRARTKVMGQWKPGEGFETKPGFMPELRVGRWQVEWQKNGENGVLAYHAKADMLKKSEELRKDPTVSEVKESDQQDRVDKYKGLRPDAYGAFIEAEQAALTSVIDGLSKESPEYQQVLSELEDEYKMGAAAANLTLSDYTKQRQLLAGREELNLAESFIHYVDSVAYTTSKIKFNAKKPLVLNDPELRSNPNLQRHARQYLDELANPTEKHLPLIKELVFFNYLGLKPSQAIVEMTQQFATHVPALINQGMGIGDAYKAAVQSLNDSVSAILKGRREKAGQSIYSDALETRAIKQAVDENYVNAGWLQEALHLEDDLPFVNARNVFAGNGKVLTREGLVGKPLYQLLKVARNFYSLSVKWNTEAAMLSSFRWFRSEGAKNGLAGESLYQHAYDNAKRLVQESMFSGGRAARPLAFLTGKLGSTVGGLMYMLQSYTYNAIAQQGRYLKNAIANTSLSPTERVSALKGAGVALTTQVLLAGVMGIPMGAQALSLVEQLFPTSEPKRKLRELFQSVGEGINSQVNLFQNNEDMGHFVSDAAMDGLLNQGPVDLSSRFQLGGLFGVDPYHGFSWANVIGPSADMLESWFVKAPQALNSGHPGEALKQLMPTSLKQLVGLATDGMQLRNQDDRLNLDLTKTEAALLAVGFKPKRVAQFQNLNEMQIRAEKTAALDQKMFHARQADLLVKGENDQVRQNLLDRAATVENYDATEGARRVAELVQQRQTPFDPSDSASRVGRTYDVAKLFPRMTSGQSEQDRLQEKHGLVQSLGFRAPLTKTELRQAQIVDQVMAMYPRMTRAEALGMVEMMLRPQAEMRRQGF